MLANFSQLFGYQNSLLAKRFFLFLNVGGIFIQKKDFIQQIKLLWIRDVTSIKRLTLSLFDGRKDGVISADEVDKVIDRTKDH